MEGAVDSMDRHLSESPPVDHDRYPDDYLRQILNDVKTIAVVGASNREIRPSYFVMKYLQGKGYRMIPINPALTGQAILGEPVYGGLADVPVPIDMVDIFRNSARSEAHTSELQSLMRISYAVLCLKNKTTHY